jgi:hypothetical protein
MNFFLIQNMSENHNFMRKIKNSYRFKAFHFEFFINVVKILLV